MRGVAATAALIVLLCAGRALADEPTPGTATPPVEPEAPFGLTWLAAKHTLGELGIVPERQIATMFGESWVVSRLPKELADMHYAVLSFGNDDQLIRIVVVGGGFEADRTGSRVTARYGEIDALLAQKYGPAGRSERHVEKSFDGEHFALGLNSKKNWMFTEYNPGQMRVELSVFWEAAKTHWRLIFEHRPGLERLQEQRRATDRTVF